jgi:hypothetical protein
MSIPLDFDGPWKEALESLLADALALLFPHVHLGIDWARGYTWLDKELQMAAPEGLGGQQTVDKLVRVWRNTGAEAWILLHLEVQSQRVADFEERMFCYHARLFDHHRHQVVSLAILGDEQPGWLPRSFGYDLWGCTLHLNYPVAKLIEFDRARLEASTNPCASIVLAHLAAQQTRHDPAARSLAKITLVRRLYRPGYTRERSLLLYRLIDWLLRLPPELDRTTWLEIRAFEEEQQMTYITTAERIGREDGLIEGRTEGMREGVLISLAALLRARFGAAGDELIPDLRQITDIEVLQRILARAATATTLDEVRAAYRAQE